MGKFNFSQRYNYDRLKNENLIKAYVIPTNKLKKVDTDLLEQEEFSVFYFLNKNIQNYVDAKKISGESLRERWNNNFLDDEVFNKKNKKVFVEPLLEEVIYYGILPEKETVVKFHNEFGEYDDYLIQPDVENITLIWNEVESDILEELSLNKDDILSIKNNFIDDLNNETLTKLEEFNCLNISKEITKFNGWLGIETKDISRKNRNSKGANNE
ncbi:hypothetical protein [Mycoplasmopsis primatum]|uniref:hypothetical protein n=1 Tax=Mycoplasmopsis primatum TaxID=55604 RepID=UPI00049695F3|nr:hypothetical protein [Mycoplasmopsis primatum]